MSLEDAPESVIRFLEVAKRLSRRLRADRAAPLANEKVRVHDGSTPLAVRTERNHHNGSTDVLFHGHVSWRTLLKVTVYGDGSSPSAADLGTDRPAGCAGLLDEVVRRVETRTDHAPQYDLVQTAADVCGALVGRGPSALILYAPTPWSAWRLARADGIDQPAPTEAAGLLSAVPEMLSPSFWIKDEIDDAPSHPCASLRGWSVVAGEIDPMTVARMLLRHPAIEDTTGKAAA